MLIRCPLCGHGRAIQPIRSAGITFKICFECVALAYDLGVKESLRDGSGRRNSFPADGGLGRRRSPWT